MSLVLVLRLLSSAASMVNPALLRVFSVTIGIGLLIACGGNGDTPASAMKTFVQAAEAQDLDRAYGTFAAEEITRREVEKIINDPVLYKGFQELKVERWVVYAPPKSERGRLTGTIVYDSGHTGKYEAEMVQTPKGWRLANVSIVVSSERIVNFGLQGATATPTK